MNHIYKYKTKMNILALSIISFIQLFFLIGAFKSIGIFGAIFFIIIMSMTVSMCMPKKIVVYDNYILISDGGIKRSMEYKKITQLKLDPSYKVFRNCYIPAILFYTDSTCEYPCISYISYKCYHKKEILSVMEFILKKNNNISLNEELIEFIK